MALGEALARCPALRLIPADPARAAELWEGLLDRLEGIGAAVESGREGEAFFVLDGLRGLYGGEPTGVMAAARKAARLPVRIAAAPSRFASFLAADRGPRLPRSAPPGGDAAIVPERALAKFLRPFPVATLSGRLDAPERQEGELIAALGRLGLGSLGKLAGLGSDQVADRFGPIGLRALRLARGEDTPLRPRAPREEVVAEIELPEGTAGTQLDHALELLVDRLLAAPARRGRTVLALRLSARLDSGGSWSAEQGLGRPTAAAQTIDSLLAPRLQTLPAPARTLQLRALALGPQAPDQLELALKGAEPRRRRLAAAVREVRAAAGPEALLRVIEVEASSRLPERRFLLSPFPEP
jgi:protein ImuB